MSSSAQRRRRREAPRGLTQEVTFGRAYDARLVKRLAVFFKPHRVLLLASLLSYPIVSVFHLLQPYLVKVAVDEHLVTRELEGFEWILLALVAAIALEFVGKFAQTLLTQLLGQRVTRDLRMRLFQKLQEVDLSYIEKNPVGRLMTRVVNDVESLTETFSTGAISIVGDMVTLFGIIVMMLALDWQLTLYAFSIMPVLFVFIMIMRRYAREAFRRVRTLLSRINAFLNEAISGMTIIQTFRQEKAMMGEFAEVNRELRDANFDAIRYDALTYAVVEGLSTIAIALLMLLGASLFERGAVEIGTVVAFIDYLRRFFAPINELSTKYTVLQSAMASAERCVELLDQEPTVVESVPSCAPGPLSNALSFENVRFAYTEEGGDVLRNVNLTFKKGEKVAVVGPTGSGKSTLVKLAARFYDPSEGRITLDGVDIASITLDNLRHRLAVVLQDAYLFEGTIRDNVRFGDPDLPEQRLREAADRTRASEVIARQPDGWDATVGERGARLSVGERQLVAFARALALDPEFLILDEATSSVDPETEALIQAGLEELIRDRTALIIAHRLSTIRSVDRIVVLSHGYVVEEGTHEELLAAGGIYRKLYELQFAEAGNGTPVDRPPSFHLQPKPA